MSKFERFLQTLRQVPRHPVSATTEEINNHLNEETNGNIPRHQTRRDLRELEGYHTLGLCSYQGNYRADPEEGEEVEEVFDEFDERLRNTQILRWYIDRNVAGMELPGMKPDAAAVLKLAQRYLHRLIPNVILENVDTYFERAEAILNRNPRINRWLQSIAMVPKALPLLPPAIDPEVMRNVYQAVLKGKQLKVAARTRQSPEVAREYFINPLGIVLREPTVYLVWTPAKGEARIKQFVLHRLESAEILDDARVEPKDFDLMRFIEKDQGFSYYVDMEKPRIRLVLRASRELQFKLRETPLSDNQRIETLDADTYRITAEVPYTHQLIAWINEQVYGAEVLEPAELRAEMIDHIQRTLANYQRAVPT